MNRIGLQSMIILFLSCSACDKQQLGCANEEEFCKLVEESSSEGATHMVRNYLASLINDNPGKKLAKLKDWLECKRCVEEAYIPCFSCIDDEPSRCEIRVDFVNQGQILIQLEDLKNKDVHIKHLIKAF